ncbi:MAG: hypothetical protein JRG71_01265 [Deltaproteobacteria bacterium]|nr:hypothetical protein [Deltaproteobacteria bacterium]
MFPIKRNNLNKILLLCVMCIQCLSLQCMAANEEITVQSKQFVSERHSSLFHRTFCRRLLSAPNRISYVECDRFHLTPCPICISSVLNDRLTVDLKDLRYEQHQREIRAANAKKKRATALKMQHQRHEALRLKKEQQSRQREIDRRQQHKDRIAREAEKVKKKHEQQQRAQQLLEKLHHQYIVDVVNIKQRLEEIEVAFTVQNVSGFSLPNHLFSAQTHIVGSLDFPLNKRSIRYGYTIQCRDPRYVYSAHDDDEPLTLLSANNVVHPIITVMSKQFFETEKTIILEDENFKVALHKINYASQLFVDISIRNKTKTVQKIQNIELRIDDVPYRLIHESTLSLPAKSAMSHLKGTIVPILSNVSRSKTIKQLSQPIIYSDLLDHRNDMQIVLSMYCRKNKVGRDSQPEFYQQVEVACRELFMQ